MNDQERIEELEGEIFELRAQLKKAKDRELLYFDLLQNIDGSLKELFKREEENERFKFNETINFRFCLVGLKESIDDFKRIYKIYF